MSVVVYGHALVFFTPGIETRYQESGWTPGLVWTVAEILVPTGIRSPERQARGESLYRLSYCGLTRLGLTRTFQLVSYGKPSRY